MYKFPETFGCGNGLQQTTSVQGEFATPLVSLPKFSPSIPVAYSEGVEDTVRKFVHVLCAANIITPTDRKSKASITQTIARALKREIEKCTGVMQKFKLDYNFSTRKSYAYYDTFDLNKDSIVLEISHTGRVPTINIASAIKKLNRIHPDLGQTIYAVLEMASIRSMGILTFNNCWNRFESELWIPYDEDMRKEFEEMEVSYRTHEDITELAKTFGISWINSAKPVLSPYEVWQITQQKRCPKWVKHCINSALEVAQAYEMENSGEGLGYGLEQQPILSLGNIEFFEQDPTEQLMDDVCHEADNCPDNFTENLHEEVISLASETEFLIRWAEITNGLKLVGKLDKLFSALEQ